MRTSRVIAIATVLVVTSVLGLFAAFRLVRDASAGGVTYVVNSTADTDDGFCNTSPDCTLREAILVAGLSQGNTVGFALPGCPATPANCVIIPGSALPPIVQLATRIDGTTQPGYSGTPIVTIDGTGLGAGIDGLAITADQVEVSGLVIQDFPNRGIQASSPTRPAFTLTHDDISNNGSTGVDAAVSLTLMISNSVISDNGNYGVNADWATTTNFVQVVENTISGNDWDGIALSPSGAVDLSLNEINMNGNLGVSAAFSTSASWNVIGNTITDNAWTGLDIAVSGLLFLGNNHILRNKNYGVNASYSTTGSVTALNNVVSDNDWDGLSLAISGGLTLNDNQINGNKNLGVNAAFSTSSSVTLERNTITGNTWDGVDVASSGSVTMSDNDVSDNGYYGVNAAYSTMMTADVRHNTFAGNTWDGIDIAVSDTLNFSDNLVTINGNDGLNASFSATSNGDVSGNEFSGNGVNGVQLSEGGGLHLRFNRIVSNATGARNAFGTLDAENNWWGCNAGPGQPSCDTVGSGVDADPWLILEIEADQMTVPENDGTQVRALLVRNSEGVVPLGGHIRDGTEVRFESDIGSVGSHSVMKTLENGTATAGYLANEGPGVATLIVRFDTESLSIQITVVPAPTPSPTATPGPTPTATPTPTPTPGPTETPGAKFAQGDVDCDGDVDPVDALKQLRHVASLPVQQTEPCQDIGGSLARIGAAGAPPALFGDVDCDGDVDSVDALKVLRHVASLPVQQTEPCRDVGT